MKLVFCEAQKADLPHLVEMLADDDLGCTREDISLPLNSRYKSAFDHITEDKNNQLIIAKMDGEIVGMLQVTFIPYLTHIGSWRCLVEGVRVHKSFRGKRLGHKLLEWVIGHARARKCSIIQLTSDKQRPDAIRFYESLGFVASHEGLKLRLT